MQSESFICQMILTGPPGAIAQREAAKGKEGKENFLPSLPCLLPSYPYLRRMLFGIGVARTRHYADYCNYSSADGVVPVSGQASCPDSGATYDRARLPPRRDVRAPRRGLYRDLR